MEHLGSDFCAATSSRCTKIDRQYMAGDYAQVVIVATGKKCTG